jgi:hypothetical protein
MRLPSERDQCQAKLEILIEGFMRADWTAYRDAATWLRDFADQKNIERGRVMCGGNWFTPQQIEAVRERARQGPPFSAPAHPRNRHTPAFARRCPSRQSRRPIPRLQALRAMGIRDWRIVPSIRPGKMGSVLR